MGVLRGSFRLCRAACFTLSLQACSAAGQNATPDGEVQTPSSGGGNGSTPNTAQAGTLGGPDLGGVDTTAGTSSGGPPGDQCAVAQAEATLTKEPVDIILVLDNSGSMAAGAAGGRRQHRRQLCHHFGGQRRRLPRHSPFTSPQRRARGVGRIQHVDLRFEPTFRPGDLPRARTRQRGALLSLQR